MQDNYDDTKFKSHFLCEFVIICHRLSLSHMASYGHKNYKPTLNFGTAPVTQLIICAECKLLSLWFVCVCRAAETLELPSQEEAHCVCAGESEEVQIYGSQIHR